MATSFSPNYEIKAFAPFPITFTDTTPELSASTAPELRTWDFGDGTVVQTYSDTIDYTYPISYNGELITSATDHIVTLTNSISSFQHPVTILGIKEDYPIIYKVIDENFPYKLVASDASFKTINLTKWLPTFLQDSEMETLLQFFEKTLNELYQFRIEKLDSPSDYELNNQLRISILEKINKIKEFHNIEKIDTEYLQLVANFLGYDVNLTAGQISINNDENNPIIDEDVRKYLRFIVSSLPEWYKIKTTKDSIKILLFSFGLIGNVSYKYTSDYSKFFTLNEGVNQLEEFEGKYPSPHFTVVIDIDNSNDNFSTGQVDRNAVVSAINSIRPVNTVFDNLTGYQSRNTVQYMFVNPINNLYQTIDS